MHAVELSNTNFSKIAPYIYVELLVTTLSSKIRVAIPNVP